MGSTDAGIRCIKETLDYKMGLDMSRAFDTVKRDAIVNLLYDARAAPMMMLSWSSIC